MEIQCDIIQCKQFCASDSSITGLYDVHRLQWPTKLAEWILLELVTVDGVSLVMESLVFTPRRTDFLKDGSIFAQSPASTSVLSNSRLSGSHTGLRC